MIAYGIQHMYGIWVMLNCVLYCGAYIVVTGYVHGCNF